MLNKVVLMGRITRDLELKHTPSNTAVISFSIAVDRAFSKEKEVDFIDIVAWGATAEFVNRYFHKGAMIAVCGSIQVRNWEDKQGQKRKSVEVKAESVSFTGEKKADSAPSSALSEFEEMEDDGDLPF